MAIAGVSTQEGASGEASAAAEPYSYGYETDTHAAAEQRDPSGRVTGYYTIADADGRQRRVEYVADEAGFHAKVATNEVGTKSGNSADVEVVASPPTEAQFVVQEATSSVSGVKQAQQQQYAFQAQRAAPQPSVTTTVKEQHTTYANQQPSTTGYASQYGYYSPGHVYGSGYSGYGGYGSQASYGSQGGYGGQGAYGANNLYSGQYSSYNNHLPSQYYKSVSTSGSTTNPGPVTYGAGNSGGSYSRYVSSVSQPTSYTTGSYRTSRYQAYGAPSGYQSVGYQTVGSPGGYQTVGVPAGYHSAGSPGGYQSVTYSSGSFPTSGTVSSGSGSQGSSNYIVLKKRNAEKDKSQ